MKSLTELLFEAWGGIHRDMRSFVVFLVTVFFGVFFLAVIPITVKICYEKHCENQKELKMMELGIKAEKTVSF